MWSKIRKKNKDRMQAYKLFVHMPKCGGTSVLKMLEQLYPEILTLDYESFFRIPLPERELFIFNSLDNPKSLPENKRLVYGHFFPIKYVGSKSRSDFRLVTILRDPIDRLISHYNFWNSGDYSNHYLWRKMKSNNWDFLTFAKSEEMRNVYSQYFALVPLWRFSYIGLYENLDESIHRCLAELKLPNKPSLSVPKLNVTNQNLVGEINDRDFAILRELHAKDYAIYDYAKKNYS